MNRFESITKSLIKPMALLLAIFVAGCGGGNGTSGSGLGSTGSVCTGANCVDLKTAANYVILDEAIVTFTPIATVSTTPTITGNIGLSPAAASFIQGFALALDAGGCFSTSTQVTGKIYAADYNIPASCPTPSLLTTAVGDKNAAYLAASLMATAGGGLPAGGPNECPGVGNLSGLTLNPGVYTCAVNVLITTGTNVTLSGAGVYVIKTTQGLTQDASTQVILTNGALPQNVFWQVAGTVSIGSSAHMEGVIMSATDINLVTGATVKGRLLARTGIHMDSNTVTQP